MINKETLEPEIKRRYLYVEDDKDQQELIKDMLESKDEEVISVARTREAKEILENNKIDLVFLNLVLQDKYGEEGKDAFELLEWIRNNDKFKDKPVYIISGLTTKKDESIYRGATGFIEKPYLSRRIKTITRNIKLNQQSKMAA